MKIKLVFIAILLMSGSVAVNAQIGNILNKAKGKPKPDSTQQPAKENQAATQTRSEGSAKAGTGGYRDSEFLLVAANGLEGQGLTKMRACVVGGSDNRTAPPMSELFISWMNHIDENAANRLYEVNDCQVIAYQIREGTATKYTSIDSLTESAQGRSIYRVESGKLVLARAIAASQFYIVVVPDHSKPGLKLADLRMCGYPDTIKLFKRKVNTGSNCHDQKQKLYVFEKYKDYPGPMQTSSVIFDAAEFGQLNTQGKFKGLVIYKLMNEELVPFK
jgi:hypothetical protein